MTAQILQINPDLDREKIASRFAKDGRVQIQNVLTDDSAQQVRRILFEQTQWELGWQAGNADGPQTIDNVTLRGPTAAQAAANASAATDAAGARGDYSCRFAKYPILTAYLERRAPAGPHDRLMEDMNGPEMLDLVRQVTGISELVKADAQATLFSGNHFLGFHDDSNYRQGWKIAYVLGFAPEDWNPDWGGYLQFFDEDGDIVHGWRPRFNVLNLMAVPCPHSVSYVPPFAPNGRVSITGWFRDR